MATKIESSRNLVSMQSIAYIRPINLTISLVGARPTTKLNVFFDGVNVNELCSGTLNSDSYGNLNTVLSIPGGRFTTGNKSIVVTDSASLQQLSITGSTFGSGSAVFSSTGILQTFQTITNSSNTVTVEEIRELPPSPISRIGDPLAQSFFTYGIKGGMFVTGISLYFSSKDEIVPVRLDIREMINGYPATLGPTDTDYVITKPASEILISSDASIETKFYFSVPVYLQEDKDYCFVVFSNSKNYNLFTSKVGELSIETGKRIFEQPFVGSLFKSENNITWVSEQFEDLKFKIYQAMFATNQTSTVTFSVSPEYWAVPGTSFYTTSGSTTIKVKMLVKHGLTETSKVTIVGVPTAIYNGIPSQYLTGNRIVSTVLDEYEFLFESELSASVTGQIITGGNIISIDVTSKGTNYTSAPTVTFSGGGGSGATAIAVVSDGQVVRIDVTSKGTNYTSAPTVTFSGGGGSGATAISNIDAMFTLLTNMPATSVAPNIPVNLYNSSNLKVTANLTNLPYEGGSVSAYSNGGSVPLTYNSRTTLPSYSVIASPINEAEKMSNLPSLTTTYEFYTENSNVSPTIDMRNSPSMIVYANNLRNRSTEDSTSTVSSSSISNTATMISGGSGYISAPTVEFISSTGSGAAATAVLGTSGISSIVVNPSFRGSGYVDIPTVDIAPPPTGIQAEATCVLTTTQVDTISIVDGGGGYTTPPSAIFTNGGDAFVSPTITIKLNATGIANILTTPGNSGSGYQSAPSVVITRDVNDTATINASAAAVVDGTGVITSINITSAGEYTIVPSISFTGGTPKPGETIVPPVAVATLVPTSVNSISVSPSNRGSFTRRPIITITAPTTGVRATAIVNLLPTSINTVIVTNSGSGYADVPVIGFIGGGNGITVPTAPIVTAYISGSVVERIDITNTGSGYMSPPIINFVRTDGSTGSDAFAVVTLNKFNSEISPTQGSNTSRYITKLIKLETVSTGANLFSEIYSENECSVDWYIRTSMSGSSTNHLTLNWIPLICDIDRNKSSQLGEKFDYKFYRYDIAPFDTYDLKCVMRSSNPVKAPQVYNYRAIILA